MAKPKSKKELDRDMMFRKIMPALAENPFALPVTDPALLAPLPGEDDSNSTPPSEDAAACVAAEAPPAALPLKKLPARRPRPTPAFPAPAPMLRPEKGEDDDLSALSAKLFARAEEAAPQLNQAATVNLMERLVAKHLDGVMQRFNCCRCDRCRRDVAAIALNQLPARYIVASAKLDASEQADSKKQVLNALVKAVLQVRNYPRH